MPLLTSLARSREALAALTLRSSTPMSHAFDLVFSHSSLYLIWSNSNGLWHHSFVNKRGRVNLLLNCACLHKVWRQVIHVSVRKINLHRCTKQHWLWLSGFGAGLGIVCTDALSSHSLLCNLTSGHMMYMFTQCRSAACNWKVSEKLCCLLTLLTSWAFFLAKTISGVSVTDLYLTWSMCCL